MTALSPQLDAAFRADQPLIFGAVEINLPGYDLRLLDGAATLPMDGHTFTGRDDTFGVLDAIDDLSDGYGDEAPGLNITLNPADEAAAASLSDPAMQGSRVRVWIGAVDRASGTVIGRDVRFDGVLDVPTLTVGKGTRSLEFDCVSGFERFFDNDEGVRLSDSFHQSVWPGELGLSNMTGLTKTSYWGAESPASNVTVTRSRGAAAPGLDAAIGARFA